MGHDLGSHKYRVEHQQVIVFKIIPPPYLDVDVQLRRMIESHLHALVLTSPLLVEDQFIPIGPHTLIIGR